MKWNLETDVVVIGSGSAGMSAALSARHHGAHVIVLERSDKLGGTSAVSGGVPWIPCNRQMAAAGRSDSREDALTYLDALSLGKMDTALCETYVDAGPEVIQFIEDNSDIKFMALDIPDYHCEHPGGKVGRALAAELFAAATMGELRPRLRMSPHFPVPITLADVADGKASSVDPALIADRMARDMVASGNALLAGLIKASHEAGVTIRWNARVRELVMENGTAVGVIAEIEGETVRIGARRGVVIASGGFEWNPALLETFVFGPQPAPLSPPFNEGDGLRMAMAAGAELGNMSEAVFHVTICIPGEEYEGRQLNRLTSAERHSPGCIMVNSAGNRFVNEALSYHDVCLAMRTFDPQTFEFPNARAWFIAHQRYFDNYPFLTVFPGDPVPRWVTRADSVRELAEKIGVDADALEQTVERFNAHARQGIDPDFERGRNSYDRYYGDRSFEGAFQTLGPLDQGPYYACEMRVGALGTRGGPRVNDRAQVRSADGGIVPGLYAAGNAMAAITGMAYPGAGGTIGPALVFGHIAGRSAAGDGNRF